MIALLFIAWVITGLVCLADLLERRADKRRNARHPLAPVVPLRTGHVRIVADKGRSA